MILIIEHGKEGNIMKQSQIKKSESVLGAETVKMLLHVHGDALWILENLGVKCSQPDMQKVFRKFEKDGKAIIYDDRIYITKALAEECLKNVPGVDEFFVTMNSFFIGGTAPYVYDDKKKEGGIFPANEHAEEISKIAEENELIHGMGRGIKLKDEVEQMNIMAGRCSKPLYLAVTNDDSLARAAELYEQRKNIMIVFCLTKPPLEVNENFSKDFVKVAKSGLPLFISAMPMAGISAPFCYNGVLAMTHAEVLFGICAAQLINPGVTCIHAGFPTIADPRIEYNPNYGLISHNFLNILMSHLNLMLDIPTCQSGGTTHEEHLTERAMADTRMGRALHLKYGVHMIRHPYSFLRYLIDFSFEKLDRALKMVNDVTPDEAPAVENPVYDERGMESIRNIGLGMYMQDPLTTANIGKIFVD